MRRRLMWWIDYTTIFELYLLLLVSGWAINLLVTEVFNSNDLYRVMRQLADQHTWAWVLMVWLGVYGWSFGRMHRRGRAMTLLFMAWWWASIAVMLGQASLVNTGVVAYGSTSLGCIVSGAVLWALPPIRRE